MRSLAQITRRRGLYYGLQPIAARALPRPCTGAISAAYTGKHAAQPLVFRASHPSPAADCRRAIQAPFLADAPPLAPPAGASTGQKKAPRRRKTQRR